MNGAPDVVRLPVTIRDADVLHFLGYPEGHRPPPRTRRHIEGLLGEARGLIDARGAYRHLPVSAAGEVGLEPIPATGLVIGLVTVGPGIETRVTELATGDSPAAALVLDAMGSAAAEEAADRLGAVVTARLHGSAEAPEADSGAGSIPSPGPDEAVPGPSCRISPGFGRWSLDAQVPLFERLPHAAVGVRLLPSLLMVPRKSISFAMWLGSEARPVAGLSGCDRCGLEHCRYRRVSQGGSRS